MVFIPKKTKSKKSKTTKTRIAHSLTKDQKAEVKKMITAPIETKYVGQYYNGSYPVLSAVNTPTDCRAFLPSLVQGTAENQRIGDEISPVRVTGFWNYWFASDQTTSAVDLVVHLLVLVSKVSPGFQTFSGLTGNTLLNTGVGLYTDPNAPDQVQMATDINKMPLNSKNWHLIKRKTFRMTKNLGQQNAESTIPSSNGQYGQSSRQIRISVTKGVKKLSYLNPTDVQPQSLYPVYITWATTVDGRAVPTGGGGAPVLRVGFRSDMYYKDS